MGVKVTLTKYKTSNQKKLNVGWFVVFCVFGFGCLVCEGAKANIGYGPPRSKKKSNFVFCKFD